jgi:hypothetical protein
LKNSDSRFGFLIADGAETITIKDITGKAENIARAQIQTRKKTRKKSYSRT